MISKDPALPDGAPRRRAPFGDGTPYFVCGPRIHEFLHEMHERGVRRPRRPAADRRRDARRDRRRGAAVHRPGPRRGRHGVPVRARRPRPRTGRSGDRTRCGCPTSRRSFGRWQAGLADVGWNSLYWNNHDQPRVVSRFGDDAAEYRVRSAKMLGTVLHLHRGTPYVYQGEELGMTNAAVRAASTTSATSSRSTTTRRRWLPAPTPDEVLARPAPGQPRQRPHADAVGRRARTPASPPARRGCGVNPNHTEINARGRRTTTRLGLRPLPPADRAAAPRAGRRRTATSRCCCPTTREVYAFTRYLDGVELLVLGNFGAGPASAAVPDAAGWAAAGLVLGNYPDARPSLELRAWEAVVLRRDRTR